MQGEMTAMSGTFGGTLQAAGCTFTGTLQAAGGTFTGTLEGLDGTFTGTIQGGSFVGGNITIGSGNNVFRAGSQGIWAGNENFSSAPFRVNMQGQLVATNANVSGTISASAGIIGGWVIQSGAMVGGTLIGGIITGATIQTDSAGTYPRISLSSAGKLLSAEGSASNI